MSVVLDRIGKQLCGRMIPVAVSLDIVYTICPHRPILGRCLAIRWVEAGF